MRYPWRTRPYAHQTRAWTFALRHFKAGNPGVALLMEPRTGKTKTTIDVFSALHMMYGTRKVFIVAPNRVIGTWIREIAAHCPHTAQVIVWDVKGRKQPLPVSMGPYDMQIVVTNFDPFGRPGRRLPSGRRSHADGRFKTRSLIQKWVRDDPAAVGVIDESHKIKNPSGSTANMIVSMAGLFRFRMALTGTPVTKANKAIDIFMQWQWLNPERFQRWGATVEDFRNHTGRWTTRNGWPQWLGERTSGMADLRRGVHADSFVVRRDECFDLPPREVRIIPVKLSSVTAMHYDEMANDMLTELRNGKIAVAKIPLVVTLRLLQLTSGFVGIPEKRVVRGKPRLVAVPHPVGADKLRALKELLVEEIIERDQKVVIGARFVYDMNKITALCRKLSLPVWSIRGGLTREQTDEAIAEFTAHDYAGAIVVQPQAGSLGIDLSTAAHMVWYSLTPSWVDYTQTNDRIALSRVSTTFTYLLGQGTIDEMLYETLQTDGDMSRRILANPEAILRR